MDVFRRRELKFLIDQQQRDVLEKLMQEKMVPDKHGRSTICNLYYDTPDYRLIRHSLEKPVYKEKLRLRSYGIATEDADVFLEMKKKYKASCISVGSAYRKMAPRRLCNGRPICRRTVRSPGK